MKKTCNFTLSLLTLITISSYLVSAQQTNFELVSENIAQAIANGLSSIRIDPATLTSILLGVLLFIVIQSLVVKVFNLGNNWWAKIGGISISLIIVILTFIYLPENFVQAIAYQYGAAGSAILSIIPFAIMLYFTVVVVKSQFLARITWIFYTVYYLAIFIFGIVRSEVGFDLTSAAWWALNLPYIAAIIAGILIFSTVGWWRKKAFKEFIESQEEEARERAEQRSALRRIQEGEAQSYGIRGRE